MDAAKRLMSELEEIDTKIAENEATLRENNTNMISPLVDADDFPLAGIDLISVRQARHDIICLQNDRKVKMVEVEKALAETHAHYSNGAEKHAESEEEVHRTSNDPIARIGEVREGSPAEKAQLQADDVVIQFGPLHAGNFQQGLAQLRDIVSASINKPIKLTVLRGTRVHRLELVPQPWPGEGVLGCTFLAVSNR